VIFTSLLSQADLFEIRLYVRLPQADLFEVRLYVP